MEQGDHGGNAYSVTFMFKSFPDLLVPDGVYWTQPRGAAGWICAKCQPDDNCSNSGYGDGAQ
jgi:hypothetical protein